MFEVTDTVITDNSTQSERPTPTPNSTPTAAPEPHGPPVANFPDARTPPRCTANVCGSGHEWNPTVQLAACPGCQSPIVLVKMENCPVCNEPVASMRLRSDHIPHGGTVTPMCKGSDTLADCLQINIARTHAQTEQAAHIKRIVPAKV